MSSTIHREAGRRKPENKNGIVHRGGFIVVSEEMSRADEARQFIEKQDEGLIDLILSGEPHQEPCFELKNVHCPLCQGDTIQITETAEGDSERVFFQMKCLDCGCEFVLFEDFIDACRRGIENAKNDIEYSKNKIEYFENKLEERS